MSEFRSAILKLLCGLISVAAGLLWIGYTFITFSKFLEMYAVRGGTLAMLVPLTFATISVSFVFFFRYGNSFCESSK